MVPPALVSSTMKTFRRQIFFVKRWSWGTGATSRLNMLRQCRLRGHCSLPFTSMAFSWGRLAKCYPGREFLGNLRHAWWRKTAACGRGGHNHSLVDIFLWRILLQRNRRWTALWRWQLRKGYFFHPTISLLGEPNSGRWWRQFEGLQRRVRMFRIAAGSARSQLGAEIRAAVELRIGKRVALAKQIFVAKRTWKASQIGVPMDIALQNKRTSYWLF